MSPCLILFFIKNGFLSKLMLTFTLQLQNCIGSAVTAMGPEKILTLIPISINAGGLTVQNMWLVPILQSHVVGASLGYYLEYIVPLAKSFQKESCKGDSLVHI